MPKFTPAEVAHAVQFLSPQAGLELNNVLLSIRIEQMEATQGVSDDVPRIDSQGRVVEGEEVDRAAGSTDAAASIDGVHPSHSDGGID